MPEQQPTGNVLPTELYGLFAGFIDQQAVQRFHNALSIASQGGVQSIHLLFQCAGGLVSEGISLYNLFRAFPIEISLYNVGSVSSIGVVAFLGAKRRLVSSHGAFMVHRAYLNPVAATADRMAAGADQLAMEDARIEGIIKSHTNLPADKWQQHKYADVWLSAAEAVSCGLAQDIGEFSPPPHAKIFNVWPPQS
jgi:ATP-dependent Clp protease, protease subunit